MPTLNELLQIKTADDVLAILLQKLQARGFPLTALQSGTDYRTILESEAASIAEAWSLIPSIAAAGSIETSEGTWLDYVNFDRYRLERNRSTFERRRVRLTCETGFGPYTIADFQLWTQQNIFGGARAQSQTGGTLADGDTLDLEFKFEFAGKQLAAALDTLLTPLPGVSITVVQEAMLEQGVDQESDEAYRERGRLRWPALSTIGAPADIFRAWAREADPSVTKVRILDQHPRGQGTVDVVLSGEGGISAGAVSAADAFIRARMLQTTDLLVYAATPKAVTLTGTVTVKSGFVSSAQTQGAANLVRLQTLAPIGGSNGNAYRSAFIEALFVANVLDVNLTTPSTNVALPPQRFSRSPTTSRMTR
ncbi:MAG: baseplate J protein [Pleurocapsa sp. SU_196_0]|nr:baseplate J protein [Pleurocapsa sp. SU_196_0]